MRTFSIKVHYRVSKMARYEANVDFQRDYYKRRKLAGRSPGNDSKVSIQWNPAIMDTFGDQHFVRYSEVSPTQGLPVYFR